MSRALKRNMAKMIKDANAEKFPSLKKMSVSNFMKKVNMNVPEDELPLDKVNKFALLMKVLQYCILIKSKNIKDEKVLYFIDRFISIFGDMRKTSRYIVYKDTLVLADKRIDCILKSINEDFDTEAFNSLDIPNAVNSLINNTLLPFVFKAMQIYIGWYREDDDIFNDNKNFISDFDAKELQLELEDYISELDNNALVRSDNLIERLLNLKHKYTTITVKKISAEIEEEINNLLSMYIHKNKEAEVIRNASNHFYKLLEIRITFSAVYDISITRNDLKLLFRACYYYTIFSINNFLEIPEDLKDLVDALVLNNMSRIIRLRVGNKFIENNEHLKTLVMTAKLDIPTTGYILDSAVEAIISKDVKLEINDFKLKAWDAIKVLLIFLNSNQCNKLYRSTYAVDLEAAKDTFKFILEDNYENHKDWFHKLLKKYEIYKLNKNYIAI